MTETILKYKKIFLLLLVSAVFFLLSFLKSGFYVDEIYSYGHANSTKGAFLYDNLNPDFADKKINLHHRWLEGKEFYDYLTVQDDERFHYGHIKENLQQSVHPPLFYVLLHTVCSFFPNTFHKALGLGLNFIILLLFFYFFYKLAEEVFSDDNKAFLTTAFFMFIPIVLQMQIYTRMYLLLMTVMTGLWWQVLLFLRDEKISGQRLLFIFGLALLSFLTHYYALIMIFFLTVIICIVFLLQKKYLKSVVFGADILLSLLVSFLLFKEAGEVLLFSDRGVESKRFITDFNWHFLADTVAFCWLQIGHSLVGLSDILLWIILPFVIAFLIYAKIGLKGGILLGAGILSGLIIAFVAPNMGDFNGRYYGGIMIPLFLVSAIAADNLLGKKISGKTIFIIWLLFFSSEMYMMKSSVYLQRDSDVSKICEITKGKQVVLQRQLFISIFQFAPCWQNTQKIYIIGESENPQNILDAKDDIIFIEEVGQGRQKYLSHARYAKDDNLKLDYIGMYRTDKILYDVYEKKQAGF